MKFIIMRAIKNYKITNKDCVIIIDVLRASSTIYYSYYFNNEVKIIDPTTDINTLRHFDNQLLLGEENGVKPRHFDFSNSPSAILVNQIQNKKILFSSSRGAKAFFKFSCNNIFVGSLVNAKSLIQYLKQSIFENVYLYPCNQVFNCDDEDYICCKYILHLYKNINFDFYKSFHRYLDKENNRFFKKDLQNEFPIFDFYLSFSLNIMNFVLQFKNGEFVKLNERN